MQLSSQFSRQTKYIIPIGVTVLSLTTTWISLAHNKPWWMPAILILLSLYLFHWSAPIFDVALENDDLIVSDGTQTVHIPISQIQTISPQRWNRTPNILIKLKRKSPLGKRVRILTPYEPNRKSFDFVVSTLQSELSRLSINDQHAAKTPDSGPNKTL